MDRRWILTALGKDRTGIVAGVTKILYERGCNLEDSAMTRLGGEFTIMLLFSAPAQLAQHQLERALEPLARRLGLAVHLKALAKTETMARRRGNPYLISVYGADRPGIVYRVSDLFARMGINITDVSTHLSAVPSTAQAGRTSPTKGTKTKPLYALLLEVELPARITVKRLEQQLHSLTKGLGVETSLRSAEAHVL